MYMYYIYTHVYMRTYIYIYIYIYMYTFRRYLPLHLHDVCVDIFRLCKPATTKKATMQHSFSAFLKFGACTVGIVWSHHVTSFFESQPVDWAVPKPCQAIPNHSRISCEQSFPVHAWHIPRTLSVASLYWTSDHLQQCRSMSQFAHKDEQRQQREDSWKPK